MQHPGSPRYRLGFWEWYGSHLTYAVHVRALGKVRPRYLLKMEFRHRPRAKPECRLSTELWLWADL